MSTRYIVTSVLLLALAGSASARPVVYVGSIGGEIYAVSDLNGDGDALDAGEVTLWADGAAQVLDLALYGDALLAVDGSAGSVYLCADLNGDGDALDAGEMVVWAEGLMNPYSAAVRDDGTVLAADYSAGQVWLLRDVNGDGDALDTGEMVLYAEGISGPVDIVVRPDDVLVTSYSAHHVRRLVDLNGDGDALDVAENMDHTPPDIPLPVGLSGGTAARYFVTSAIDDAVYRVEDLNGDGDAFDVVEVLSYADSVFEEIDFPWGLVDCPGLGLLVTEYNDGQISLIRDLNGDGDALDIGETVLFADGVLRPTGMAYAADPLEILAELAPGEDWVYQNTQTTTADGHRSTLTISFTSETCPGEDYTVEMTENGGPLMNFTFAAPQQVGDTLVVEIIGGRVATTTANAPGSAALMVTLTGQSSAVSASADVDLQLRKLGDVDGSGGDPVALDKQNFNKRLNGIATGLPERAFDLNASGGAPNAIDKQIMNQLLNGVSLP